MNIDKPKLTPSQLVAHLKSKGVTFEIIKEDEAESYLRNNSNYFKLASYRKNYSKHPGGEKEGQYANLEFAYLVDLATIDMKLRYQILRMALDIEHHTKLELLRTVDDCENENGYSIVSDYLDSLSEKQRIIADNELKRNKKSTYCSGIYEHYEDDFPIWAFVEIIPFGRLVDFYKFCASRFNDKGMMGNFFMLLSCKEIRNAAAHSSCILNDLNPNSAEHSTSYEVSRALMKIDGVTSKFRDSKMSNSRVQEFITLLYMHVKVVKSKGVHEGEWKDLKTVIDRMYKNEVYYKSNENIMKTFDFFKMVVDSWN